MGRDGADAAARRAVIDREDDERTTARVIACAHRSRHG